MADRSSPSQFETTAWLIALPLGGGALVAEEIASEVLVPLIVF
jgi:hypothetical protein